jgi:hypothetical protein
MKIIRNRPQTPNVNELSMDLAQLNNPCVGCCDCVGLCDALIDALVLPDLVLSKRREYS